MDDPGGQPDGLAPIRLTDKPLFDRALAPLAQPISDYSFANTFIWSTSLKLYWAMLENHLCVLANGTGDLTMLMPPVPTAPASDADLRHCLRHCFELMDRYNDGHSAPGRSRIEYVSDEMLERLSAIKGVQLAASPFSGDYVYDTRRMIDLEGKKLKSKRHARSRFIREYPDHRLEDLHERHIPACLDLLHLWQAHGDHVHLGEVNEHHIGSDILRHRDTLACQLALRSFRPLGLRGMALLVADRLVGFTLGEPITATQFSVLIEKTHPDYYGSAQFIFSEFCRLHAAHLPECNVGDDWGIPSLRFTKSSYRPIRLLSKYTLTMTRPLVVACPGLDLPLANPVHHIAADPAASPGLQLSHAPVTLRLATVDDVEPIGSLERRCFDSPEETLTRRQIRYLVTHAKATVHVAEHEGHVVGWAAGLVRQHRHSRSGRVYAVAVKPELHGRGVGRQLVQATIDALAAHAIRRLYLEVRADNQPAIHLYHKLGFATHARLPNYYGDLRHGLRMKMAVDASSLFQPANAATAAAAR